MTVELQIIAKFGSEVFDRCIFHFHSSLHTSLYGISLEPSRWCHFYSILQKLVIAQVLLSCYWKMHMLHSYVKTAHSNVSCSRMSILASILIKLCPLNCLNYSFISGPYHLYPFGLFHELYAFYHLPLR